MSRVGRRRFLTGLGATAATLPFLRRFPARGDAVAQPKLVIFSSPNGFLVGPNGDSRWGYEGWRPAGFPSDPRVGTSMALPATLPTIFRPLERHRDRLLFLEGLREIDTGHGPHDSAPAMLSSVVPIWIDNSDAGGVKEIYGAGVSIDQLLRERLSTEPLHLCSPLRNYNPNEAFISFRGERQPVTPIQSPIDAFDRVFTGATPATSDRRGRRAEVLRFLDGEFADVVRRASRADRPHLEAHRDSLSRLGTELDRAAMRTCDGGGVTRPEEYAFDDGTNLPRLMRDYADILADALHCGWTQIGLIQIGNLGGGGPVVRPRWSEYGMSGVTTSEHSLAHGIAGHSTLWESNYSREEVVALAVDLQAAYSDMFAYLLDRLAEREDVDGQPLLHNTIVIHVKPAGINHDHDVLLHVLAGGQGLGIAGGEFRVVGIRDQEPYRHPCDLWTTICHLMGARDVETFGEARFNREPLALS